MVEAVSLALLNSFPKKTKKTNKQTIPRLRPRLHMSALLCAPHCFLNLFPSAFLSFSLGKTKVLIAIYYDSSL